MFTKQSLNLFLYKSTMASLYSGDFERSGTGCPYDFGICFCVSL